LVRESELQREPLLVETQGMKAKPVKVHRQVRLLELVKVRLGQERIRAPLQLTRALRLAPRWPVLGLSGRGPTVAACVSAGVGESASIRAMIPPVVRNQASKDDSRIRLLRLTVEDKLDQSRDSC
jgi:hypothetical protein